MPVLMSTNATTHDYYESHSDHAGEKKGRPYPPMTREEREWLDTYYTPHNTRLRHLLTELGRTLPGWLVNATSTIL